MRHLSVSKPVFPNPKENLPTNLNTWVKFHEVTNNIHISGSYEDKQFKPVKKVK